MENLKRSIKYQWMESKGFILKFWAIVFIVDIFFYVLNKISTIHIGFSLGVSGESSPLSVVGSNILIILITLLVYNFERNYKSFPMAVSLSMNRKEYFVSFLADNIFIAFIFANIQGVLLKMDPFFMKLLGKVPIYDFIYFNVKTDHIFYIIFILFVLFLGFISFWNVIASLNYKFGYKIWIIAVALNMVLSLLNIEFIGGILKFIGNMLSPRLGASQVVIIFSGIGISYILNYFIVSRTNIKGKIG